MHLWRYIAKYVYESMPNKRFITLPMVNCGPSASEKVFLAILKDFKFDVYCASFY